MKEIKFYIKKLNEKQLFHILFLAIPLIYYSYFMSRTIGYVDSSLVLINSYNPNISAWVDNHNLFSLISYLLIQIFSKKDPFVVANTFSMVCGSLTVYISFLLSKEISKNSFIASAVSLTLMLSHSLTWHSTMLEVYTLNCLLIMLILYCIYIYFERDQIVYAYAGSFAWGLGISNHMLMGLFVFSFILFLIIRHKSLSLKRVTIGIFSFLMGLSLFLYAFIKSALENRSLFKVLDLNTGGDFRSLMFSTDDLGFWIGNYFIFFLYQFSILAIIIGFIGFKSLLNKKPFSVFFLTAFISQIIWSINYHVWDIFAFSLPVYIMFTVPVTSGLKSIKNAHIRKNLLILILSLSLVQTVVYQNIGNIKYARIYISHYPMVEMIGSSFDPVLYFLKPWKRDFKQVDIYVDKLFEMLPENASIFDNLYDYPIVYYYQQVKKERHDLYVPIIFPFWVKEDEIKSWSEVVNRKIRRSESVYLSEFVFSTLDNNLKYGKKEVIYIINNEYLYQLYK